MSNLGNTSNPRLGFRARPKHFTPKVLFLVVAVPIAALIIWFATRIGTMKRAVDLGYSVSHRSSLLASGTKPKPPAGKLLEQPATAPAPRPPAPNWSNPQAANAVPASPAQVAPSPTAPVIAPALIPGVAPSTASVGRPAYAPLSYNARHEKAFGGGCSGRLILSSAGLQFNCPSDSHASMEVALSEISAIDENGVRLTSGKKLHFAIGGMSKPNEQALFTDWFNRLH